MRKQIAKGRAVVEFLVTACVLAVAPAAIGQTSDTGVAASTDASAVAADPNVIVQISAGSAHTCARRASGTVLCWGYNQEGDVGDGTIGANRVAPVAVVGLTDAIEISAGGAHSCARRTSGVVVCWGNNDGGRIGDGTTTRRTRPVRVSGLADAVEISAGTAHTCARRRSGAVVCWGANNQGQLGSGAGSQANSLTPVAVTGLTDAVEISADMAHTCARRASGVVVCWGDDEPAQPGERATRRSAPAAIPGLTDAVQIAAGGSHTCVRRASGSVVCWGANTFGQWGNGTSRGGERTHAAIGGLEPVAPPADVTPVAVRDLSDAVDLDAGSSHTCARRAAGTVVCWGSNHEGRLGDGTRGNNRLAPVVVTGLTDAAQVSAGGGHSCARRASGAAVCWGDNQYGQLGDATTTNRLTPVAVAIR